MKTAHCPECNVVQFAERTIARCPICDTKMVTGRPKHGIILRPLTRDEVLAHFDYEMRSTRSCC